MPSRLGLGTWFGALQQRFLTPIDSWYLNFLFLYITCFFRLQG
jgi:hypothetical protein